MIEEDHCFEVMTRVWVDSSAKYEFEYAQSTVNDVNLPKNSAENWFFTRRESEI